MKFKLYNLADTSHWKVHWYLPMSTWKKDTALRQRGKIINRKYVILTATSAEKKSSVLKNPNNSQVYAPIFPSGPVSHKLLVSKIKSRVDMWLTNADFWSFLLTLEMTQQASLSLIQAFYKLLFFPSEKTWMSRLCFDWLHLNWKEIWQLIGYYLVLAHLFFFPDEVW